MTNSPARSTIDVGSVIAETYKIEALIGRGGMGAVFLASHRRLPGKQVAIKLLHAEITDDEVLARFRREAEIASKLGHPNIVTVHDFNVTADGTPYLVLEYLHGETLARRLAEGPLPLTQVIPIVRQVGSALAAAHREGIVHRDLKPQNIFLIPTEVGGHVVEVAKVLDFGISKIRGSQTVKTQESTLLGTPQYMAPEQARGDHKAVDERTDIFALGAIVYEMLAGHPAFGGANIPEVVFKVVYEDPVALEDEAPGVAPEVVAAVNRAMAKPAADRFPTVADFVTALTGQPLSQFRVPAVALAEVGAPTGKLPHTGQDAFANTMGSVDTGDPPVPPLPASLPRQSGPVAAAHTVAAPPPSMAPHPPTVAAGALASTTAGAGGAPASVAAQAPAAPAAHRRSPLAIALVAVAAAAAAVAVMYFVMRDPGAQPSGAAAPSDAARTVAVAPGGGPPSRGAPGSAGPGSEAPSSGAPSRGAPADAGAAAPDQPDDAAPVTAAPRDAGAGRPPRDAAVARPPQDAQRAPVEPPPDEDDLGGARERLQQARAALQQQDFATAARHARAVANAPEGEASARQRAVAAAIAGIVDCQNDDLGAARTWQRRIQQLGPRARAAYQQLVQGCRAHGHPEF